eukprot:m.489283 g.489283  ORF g.489283 m.489283 type:complete len:208 (+) comp21764_c0_seq2:316-939(+)
MVAVIDCVYCTVVTGEAVVVGCDAFMTHGRCIPASVVAAVGTGVRMLSQYSGIALTTSTNGLVAISQLLRDTLPYTVRRICLYSFVLFVTGSGVRTVAATVMESWFDVGNNSPTAAGVVATAKPPFVKRGLVLELVTAVGMEPSSAVAEVCCMLAGSREYVQIVRGAVAPMGKENLSAAVSTYSMYWRTTSCAVAFPCTRAVAPTSA